jgi:AraC-like DNA-binding protein
LINTHSHITNLAKRIRNAGYNTRRLACACGLKPWQLNWYFLKLTGLSVHLAIFRVRQLDALYLLLQGLTIKDVAWELGYITPSNFWRDFKRVHGLTPATAITWHPSFKRVLAQHPLAVFFPAGKPPRTVKSDRADPAPSDRPARKPRFAERSRISSRGPAVLNLTELFN